MTDMVFGNTAIKHDESLFMRWWRTVDRLSLLFIIALFSIGILLGLAASVPLAQRNGLDPFYYVYKQLFFGGTALGVMLFLSMRSPKFLRRIGIIGFVIGLISLALLPALGTDFGKGAVRWYSLGFASVQPSEFLKPFFVIFVAWLMTGSFQVGGIPGQRVSFFICLVVVALLAMQPDFGQASLLLATWGLMYFVAGAPILLLMVLFVLTIAAGFVAYENSEHFARRIDGFLNPDIDPRTQIGYATNAIQEGGFFGVGVGEGAVKWSLPDAHTDFIIAVAAEEYGLVLVLLIIGLFALITFRAFMRAMREQDIFIRLSITGLASLFGLQAMINMGVAVRLLPAKGMTLPFVSYGGSSLVAGGIAIGMLLALTRIRTPREMDPFNG